jgi:hypothetical protein
MVVSKGIKINSFRLFVILICHSLVLYQYCLYVFVGSHLQDLIVYFSNFLLFSLRFFFGSLGVHIAIVHFRILTDILFFCFLRLTGLRNVLTGFEQRLQRRKRIFRFGCGFFGRKFLFHQLPLSPFMTSLASLLTRNDAVRSRLNGRGFLALTVVDRRLRQRKMIQRNLLFFEQDSFMKH